MKNFTLFFCLMMINILVSQNTVNPGTGDAYLLFGPNTNWSQYFQVGGNGRVTSHAGIFATNGNLHLDSKNGPFSTYINYYSQGNTILNSQGGNVGIGTSNPAKPLHISSSSGHHQIRLQGINDMHTWMQFYPSGSGVLNWQVGANPHGFSIYDLSNAIYRLTVSNSGNVGVGTASPDSKLTVKGDIHAEEVKVDLSVPGPDYVFKKEYDLKSLEEVQKHIDEHGHLPNIPSAQEMEANGIQLGEMNMKLLEKIEELTLYTLQQQKQLNTYKQNIQKLHQRLRDLETNTTTKN